MDSQEGGWGTSGAVLGQEQKLQGWERAREMTQGRERATNSAPAVNAWRVGTPTPSVNAWRVGPSTTLKKVYSREEACDLQCHEHLANFR